MKRLTIWNETYKEHRNEADVSINKCIAQLASYEVTGLDPEEIEGLKKSEDFWHREAVRLAAELGELKLRIGKLIESNLSH